MSRANYGIDAPPVILIETLGGAAFIIGGTAAFRFLTGTPSLKDSLGYWGIFTGVSMLLMALSMIWSSKVGKLRKREMLIESLQLKGNETVLDVGCGRGLLLIEAAKHLPNGKAIGVDIWQSVDL